jgi:hypothetical protein
MASRMELMMREWFWYLGLSLASSFSPLLTCWLHPTSGLVIEVVLGVLTLCLRPLACVGLTLRSQVCLWLPRTWRMFPRYAAGAAAAPPAAGPPAPPPPPPPPPAGRGRGGGRGAAASRLTSFDGHKCIGKSWMLQLVLVKKLDGLCLGVVGGKFFCPSNVCNVKSHTKKF